MEHKAELLHSLAPLMFAKITEAQKILAEWIVPDNKASDTEALNLLLGILDDRGLVEKMREINPLKIKISHASQILPGRSPQFYAGVHSCLHGENHPKGICTDDFQRGYNLAKSEDLINKYEIQP